MGAAARQPARTPARAAPEYAGPGGPRSRRSSRNPLGGFTSGGARATAPARWRATYPKFSQLSRWRRSTVLDRPSCHQPDRRGIRPPRWDKTKRRSERLGRARGPSKPARSPTRLSSLPSSPSSTSGGRRKSAEPLRSKPPHPASARARFTCRKRRVIMGQAAPSAETRSP